MKYRIVRNGLGEYGILNEYGEFEPMLVGVGRTAQAVKWATLEIAKETRERLLYKSQQSQLRNTWEVVE